MNPASLHNILVPIYSVDEKLDFLPNAIRNERIDREIETKFFRNFSSNPFEEPNFDIMSLIQDNFSNSIWSMFDEDSLPSSVEVTPILKGPSSNDSFSSSVLSNISISTESNSALIEDDDIFLERKRAKIRKSRKYNNDDMRSKIKRGFFNDYLIPLLNNTLKSIGNKKYFEKFPNIFSSDICRKRNKDIVDMTIGEIFENKEIYANEKKKGWLNYWHNLKVVQSKEIKENEEIKKIINRTFCQLYEEYIRSNAFKIDEINRLKSKNVEDDYIKKYKLVAKHLLQFFIN